MQRKSPLANEPCPCESGRTFRRCCRAKRFKWERRADGSWSRIVPMDDALRAVVESTRARFVEVFRREPGPTDRFDVNTYVISVDDFTDEVVRAMGQAGTDPALVYAFKKTGRILLSTTTDLVPDSQIQEWREAIEEYQDALAEGRDLLLFEATPALVALESEAERLPYILGKLIADASDQVDNLPDTIELFKHTFALFALTRGAKSFRAIGRLIDGHLNEDALNVCRAVYESYLTIVYLLARPEEWFQLVNAKIGLEAGTHTFGTSKRGKPNRRVIVELATGREVRAEISTYEMAVASPHRADADLHGHLYSLLSAYTHPHPAVVGHYLSPTGFTTTGRTGADEARVLSLLCCGLLLDAAIQLPALAQVGQRDVSTFLRHLKVALQSVHADANDSSDQLAAAILARTAFLGERWPV